MSMVYAYLKDTFLQVYETRIKSIGTDSNGIKIQLEDTIFHPKGGGQKDDLGKINDTRVIAVIKDSNNEINHYVEQANFTEGQKVSLTIDFNRRLQNAALHSAGHILAAITEKIFPQLQAFQGHHYPNEACIKFKIIDKNFCLLDKRSIQEQLEKAMIEYISSSLSIVILFDKNIVRNIQIDVFPPVGCGGTHLANANQLASFTIRNIKIIKNEVCQIGYNATPKTN